MKNNHTQPAFDAFYAEGGATAGNAARLAAEDHASQEIKNWAFIEALREAGKRSDAHDELLAALKVTQERLSQLGFAIPEVDAAIAKAEAQ